MSVSDGALREVIVSQYLAALEMLARAVEACPETLWDDPSDKNRFWQVAYHALFYTHLYLQPAEADFEPWVKHQDGAHSIGAAPEEGDGESALLEPYVKQDVLAYLDLCRQEVRLQTDTLEPAGASGFYWLSFSKLELQFYSIRHIQQHAGELFERLGVRAGIDLDWVGKAPNPG